MLASHLHRNRIARLIHWLCVSGAGRQLRGRLLTSLSLFDKAPRPEGHLLDTSSRNAMSDLTTSS